MIISISPESVQEDVYRLSVSESSAIFLDVLDFCFGDAKINRSSMKIDVRHEILSSIEESLYQKWVKFVQGEAVDFLSAKAPLYSKDYRLCTKDELCTMLDNLAQFSRINLFDYPAIWHEISSNAEDMMLVLSSAIGYNRLGLWYDDEKDIWYLFESGFWQKDYGEARGFIEKYHFPSQDLAHYRMPEKLNKNLNLLFLYGQDMDYAWRNGVWPLAVIRN